jgi:hypothetical protein
MLVGSVLLMTAVQTVTGQAAAKCSTITGSDLTNICMPPNYTGNLITAAATTDCATATCGSGDAYKCCAKGTTCTSDYKKDNMVASGAGTARGSEIKFTCDSGYEATEGGVATCSDMGTWSGGECVKSIPACSVTDGSAATPWTTGYSGSYEMCTCAGAATYCSTLNVCNVAKKTCVCTPGKDHWCYQSNDHTLALKFGCFKESDQYYQGYKCDGDSVVSNKYSDDKCTTEVTVENGGQTYIFTSTKRTSIEMDSGSKKTKEDTTITGISTCKGGVAAPSEAEKAEAGKSPAGNSTENFGNSTENAGSVTQCSTDAMLIVVVTAMWAGRN